MEQTQEATITDAFRAITLSDTKSDPTKARMCEALQKADVKIVELQHTLIHKSRESAILRQEIASLKQNIAALGRHNDMLQNMLSVEQNLNLVKDNMIADMSSRTNEQ